MQKTVLFTKVNLLFFIIAFLQMLFVNLNQNVKFLTLKLEIQNIAFSKILLIYSI